MVLMISDFVEPDKPRRKMKHISPLEKPEGKSIHELVAEHDAREVAPEGKKASSSEELAPAEVPFVPPDEIVDQPSNLDEETRGYSTITESQQPAPVSTKYKFLSWKWTLGRKWTIIISALVVVLIGGGGIYAYLHQPHDLAHHTKVSKSYVPKDSRVPSTLTGLLVDPSVNQRPVTGVMIENSQDARPQSGLDQAGVVFEAIAEGGITRFLALFQDTQPDYVGPIRSARPYYVQWCMGFDCALAHAGGSPEALNNIRSWGTKDLNDTAGIFWRVNSRYAPHNLYSSIPKLGELESSKGYGTPSFTGFSRKKDQPLKISPPANGKTNTHVNTSTPQDNRTPAASIDVAISSAPFNSHYDYDTTTNSYRRSQAGAPHITIDSVGSQTQITPKVVVVMVVPYGIEADDLHSQYTVTGSGQALVFQDGTVTQATWNKADTVAPLVIKDTAGKDLTINAGQTWLAALSAANLVTYR